MENIWLASGKPMFAEELVREFVCIMNSYDSSLRISESIVVDILRKEHALFEEVLNRGIRVIQKNSDVSEKILLDTSIYISHLNRGLYSEDIVRLIRSSVIYLNSIVFEELLAGAFSKREVCASIWEQLGAYGGSSTVGPVHRQESE